MNFVLERQNGRKRSIHEKLDKNSSSTLVTLCGQNKLCKWSREKMKYSNAVNFLYTMTIISNYNDTPYPPNTSDTYMESRPERHMF